MKPIGCRSCEPAADLGPPASQEDHQDSSPASRWCFLRALRVWPGEWNQATFKPVCGSVSIASLACMQCYRGKSLRDISALNHAPEVAAKRARVEEPSIS